MDTRLKSISLVPLLRFLAVIVTLAGALLTCYGLTEGPNFPYAFQSENYAESAAQRSSLYQGLHYANTLRHNHDRQNDWTYQNAQKGLAEPYQYLYYTQTEDGTVLTNVGDVTDVEGYFASLPANLTSVNTSGIATHIGVSLEEQTKMAKDYAISREKGIRGGYFALFGAILGLLGVGYVMYSAGDQAGTSEVRLSTLDRLYLDVGFFVYSGLSAVALRGMYELWEVYRVDGSQLALAVGALLAVLTTLLGLQYLSSVAKRFKRREFFKHTLVYAAFAWVFGLVASLWDNIVRRATSTGSLAVRSMIAVAGYSGAMVFSMLLFGFSVSVAQSALLALFSLGFLAVIGLYALRFTVARSAEFKQVLEGAARVKKGELTSRIPETGFADLGELAKNINNIAQGLEAAVESEVKSERMKAELITNVSHDLKTPLTSIVTYVDLLKTEGLESENAPRYLEVLDQKTQRLKVLTEDLFEAAKAASGSLAIKLERIDVGSLLTQGLGELSDKIADSGLDFRVNIPTDKLYVQADGRLLWRAVENILSNTMKYALTGSRVYIDVLLRREQVTLVFKNISATPLNIPAEELIERFKRGDESRSTEGSGLGLSIAKSLVELQGGVFKVEIDGDLFKVTMTLPEFK